MTAPDLPTGWSITQAYAAAIKNQDPQTEAEYSVVAGTDMAAPWEIVLAGLDTGDEYVVGGWFKFARPDGSVAYGRSLQDVATPS